MKDSFERRLEAAHEAYIDAIQKVADEIREKYVIPFCDKHDLMFNAGMGTWSFWARKRPGEEHSQLLREATARVGGGWDTQEAPLGYLHSGERTRRYRCKRMLRLLNACPEGDSSQSLGAWMDPYTPN